MEISNRPLGGLVTVVRSPETMGIRERVTTITNRLQHLRSTIAADAIRSRIDTVIALVEDIGRMAEAQEDTRREAAPEGVDHG